MSGSPQPASFAGPERRAGKRDRRVAEQDRRNEDRVADDVLPRRNPDLPDRRRTPR